MHTRAHPKFTEARFTRFNVVTAARLWRGRVILKCSPTSSWMKNWSDEFPQSEREKKKTESELQRAFSQPKKRKVGGLSLIFHLNSFKTLQKGLKWKSNMLVPDERNVHPKWRAPWTDEKRSIMWKTKWNGILFPVVHKNRIPRTKDTNVIEWYLHPKSSEREREFWNAEMKQKFFFPR